VVVEHGHRDVKTTLTVYAHLINTDDHSGNMAAARGLGDAADLHRKRGAAARLGERSLP
jgi:hypothetical protein